MVAEALQWWAGRKVSRTAVVVGLVGCWLLSCGTMVLSAQEASGERAAEPATAQTGAAASSAADATTESNTPIPSANSTDGPLRVAIHPAPPFVMMTDSGEWTGITLDLWSQIAEGLGRDFEVVPMQLHEIIPALEDGSVDVAAAALTITPERAARVDFTHPYFDSGLSVASSPTEVTLSRVFWQIITSNDFRSVMLGLVPLLVISGFVMWLVERQANPDQFGGGPVEGTAKGLWWSAVTMTTVGYGDKAPVTAIGRVIAIGWMFACLVLVSTFTGAVASLMTVGNLETGLVTEKDLPSVRVATVKGSTGERYLTRHSITPTNFATLDEALQALTEHSVDAVVHDQPILQYQAANKYAGSIQVLPYAFSLEEYGFALTIDSDLRKAINLELLRVLRTNEWEQIQIKHLGTTSRQVNP